MPTRNRKTTSMQKLGTARQEPTSLSKETIFDPNYDTLNPPTETDSFASNSSSESSLGERRHAPSIRSRSSPVSKRDQTPNKVQEKEWLPLMMDLSKSRRKGIIVDLTKSMTDGMRMEIASEQIFDLTIQKTRARVYTHERMLRIGALINERPCVINFKMIIRTNEQAFDLDPIQLLVDGATAWKKERAVKTL